MEKLLASERSGQDQDGNVTEMGREKKIIGGHRRQKKRPSKDVEVLLWTDASLRGYGAYYRMVTSTDAAFTRGVISHDNGHSFNNNNCLISPNARTWLSQPWPDIVQNSFLNDDTNFLEFYAAVSAFYTWRRTFRGKRVTLHTDSGGAANYVNKGIPDWVYLDNNHGRWRGTVKNTSFQRYKRAKGVLNHHELFDRDGVDHDADEDDEDEDDSQDLPRCAYFYVAHLHSLLMKTKYQAGVDLSAVSISRDDNQRADALARGDVEAFWQLAGGRVPFDEAGGATDSRLPKRAKQLTFLPVFRLFPFLPSIG